MEHAAKTSVEERGAIFTRSEVVDFILDLACYTIDRPLHRFRLLEPSFGDGDFLLPAVVRLLTAYETHVKDRRSIADHLCDAIRAVEVHQESVKTTRRKLLALFRDQGVPIDQARRLLDAWIIQGDFLLVDLPQTFTHAVGNPPYVRQEMIPDALLTEYRARYSTIYDRADLYVPFIERCLDGLEPGGVLGFICSDRWMKNKYGAPLREMVARSYHLACYVDMVDTPAFHSDVIAYPAITMIKREQPGPTRIAHRPKIQRDTLAKLARSLSGESLAKGNGVIEVDGIVKGQEPWILQSFDQLAVVRRLETDFPLLEDAGCKVGIGVATGADRVFISPYETLNVEPDRKLPSVTTRDIAGGTVKWKGLGVINPFLDDGSLVNLADYPKLARHFAKHEEIVRKRNCASKNPKGWYRTIDRILPGLTLRPKLLIPDIKGSAHVVFENGRYYPHHNLYHITSDEWDLRALQAVLQSGIAKLFVSTYSTQMRGGYLRFQAQYLRRIRIPLWKDVPKSVRKALADAAKSGDIEACNQVTFDLYRLSFEERAAIMCLGK
jgi:hypothetical protein